MLLLQLSLIALTVALGPLLWIWRQPSSSRMAKLAWITTALAFDLIVFGAFTRLTDSGLGCPDWPGCYTQASPLSAQQAIAAAEQLAPNGPVTWFKAWIEMIHRYMAMTIGLLVLTQLIFAWRTRRSPRGLLASFLLLALVGLQGAFGAWTVTLKLAPIVVSIHLLLGMVFLAALAGYAAGFAPPDRSSSAAALGTGAWLNLGAGALLLLQIFSGGWVSANYAVLACQGFPTCNGQWKPAMDWFSGLNVWRWRDLGELTAPALVAIQWTHRVLAALTLLVLSAWAMATRDSTRPRNYKVAWPFLGLLGLQAATGVATVLWHWPLPLALLHNAGAALLLLCWVVLSTKRKT